MPGRRTACGGPRIWPQWRRKEGDRTRSPAANGQFGAPPYVAKTRRGPAARSRSFRERAALPEALTAQPLRHSGSSKRSGPHLDGSRENQNPRRG